MIDVKGDPGEAGFLPAIREVLGFELPIEPRRSAIGGKLSALWLSVDQWLILCPREEAEGLRQKLAAALAGCNCLVVDMSDARIVLRLIGLGAREMLMKGTPVDLTRPEVHAGLVRRLSIAEVPALLHVVADVPETLDLYVFRSYAAFIRQFLEEAAQPGARLRLFRSGAEGDRR
jgi:sarcosine oxidase subunit gamma